MKHQNLGKSSRSNGHDFIKMIQEYRDQDQLEGFRREWDGNANFKITDDHTVIANIVGEEKLLSELKQKAKQMVERFNDVNYG